jgi:uncharacterized protein (UPF0335 family)
MATDSPSNGNGGHDALEQARLEHLPVLTLRIRTAMAKGYEVRADIGQLYLQAEEYGYHRRALKEAIRLADMEPAKLRDYLTALNRYCEVLNVFAQEELLDEMPRPPAPPPQAEPKAPIVETPIATGLGLVAAAPAPGRKKAPSQQPTLAATRRAQGRADALQGFNETRNPWPEGSRAYASYHQGWVEGNAELETQHDKSKRRSRRKPPEQPQPGV